LPADVIPDAALAAPEGALVLAPDVFAVRLDSVVAGYGREPPTLVEATLSLAAGGSAVVHGGAGAGKTTLLHVLRTVLEPRAGTVRLLGSDPAALPNSVRWALKRRIGYIAQAPALFEDLSAFENIAYPLRLIAPMRGDPRVGADVSELMQYLGLFQIAPQPARLLSESQRRLVAIARAVVGRPDILLADEPLTGLGADAMARVLRLISELARQRAAVVVTTQSPETYGALAASRHYIERGRLVA
jgi:ABC-type multidrug transport system ATPase subunit